MSMIFASSLSLITGHGSTICRHEAGPAASRFCLEPMDDMSEVTKSSLIASSGGLVTWANIWVK